MFHLDHAFADPAGHSAHFQGALFLGRAHRLHRVDAVDTSLLFGRAGAGTTRQPGQFLAQDGLSAILVRRLNQRTLGLF